MVFNFMWDYGTAMVLSALIATQFESNVVLIFAASMATALGTLYIATLTAKLYASKHSDKVIDKLGWLIIGTYWAMFPVVSVISTPFLVILRLILNDESEKLSDTELLGILAMAKKDGLLANPQHRLIKRIIGLHSKTVKDLLPEGQAIESVDIEDDLINLEDKLLSGCHKRIVVTKRYNDKEYPVGILTFKDIVKVNVERLKSQLAFSMENGNLDAEPGQFDLPSIAELMHPCVVTPETEVANVLLAKLAKGDHIVVATNENGVMTGVLQSDDIIYALTSA